MTFLTFRRATSRYRRRLFRFQRCFFRVVPSILVVRTRSKRESPAQIARKLGVAVVVDAAVVAAAAGFYLTIQCCGAVHLLGVPFPRANHLEGLVR